MRWNETAGQALLNIVDDAPGRRKGTVPLRIELGELAEKDWRWQAAKDTARAMAIAQREPIAMVRHVVDGRSERFIVRATTIDMLVERRAELTPIRNKLERRKPGDDLVVPALGQREDPMIEMVQATLVWIDAQLADAKVDPTRYFVTQVM